MDDSDEGYPVAYCAPGKRFSAALTLMFKGEQVARIVEHPWLEPGNSVIVVSEPPGFSFEPEAFRVSGSVKDSSDEGTRGND